MKSKFKKWHSAITIISIIMLMIISYTTLFQPTYFYETSYKYETTDSKYQHDVNITVSIKGQTFSSIIIVREVGFNENKNYYKVKGSGNILKENTHQYYLVFDNIDVYTGTSEADMKPYTKPNSTQNLIDNLNNIKILYLSDEYIVVALFFYDGQILTLHKY
ncbi:hypothetical protein O1C85_000050 [Vibrio cholerae]|nr:hypothetical protein [Vibrio cholerae]